VSDHAKRYIAFSVSKNKKGQTVWVRAGQGQGNRDGSISIYLDVLPIDGELHLRDQNTVNVDQPPPKPEGT
jgi:hypothetical protein